MPTNASEIVDEIQKLYSDDPLPWIVGYSGGKDSSASLQLIWNAVAALPLEKRLKPIHVISTDTLVENPIIAAWVKSSLGSMKIHAKKQNIPIYPHHLVPSLSNRFWVNLIGRGYPAPRPKFRWCTDRLKISASTEFIREKFFDKIDPVQTEIWIGLSINKNRECFHKRVLFIVPFTKQPVLVNLLPKTDH